MCSLMFQDPRPHLNEQSPNFTSQIDKDLAHAENEMEDFINDMEVRTVDGVAVFDGSAEANILFLVFMRGGNNIVLGLFHVFEQ